MNIQSVSEIKVKLHGHNHQRAEWVMPKVSWWLLSMSLLDVAHNNRGPRTKLTKRAGCAPIKPQMQRTKTGYWRVVGVVEELIDKAKELSQRTRFVMGFARILKKI